MCGKWIDVNLGSFTNLEQMGLIYSKILLMLCSYVI